MSDCDTEQSPETKRLMRQVKLRWRRGDSIGMIARDMALTPHAVCELLVLQGIYPGLD